MAEEETTQTKEPESSTDSPAGKAGQLPILSILLMCGALILGWLARRDVITSPFHHPPASTNDQKTAVNSGNTQPSQSDVTARTERAQQEAIPSPSDPSKIKKYSHEIPLDTVLLGVPLPTDDPPADDKLAQLERQVRPFFGEFLAKKFRNCGPTGFESHYGEQEGVFLELTNEHLTYYPSAHKNGIRYELDATVALADAHTYITFSTGEKRRFSIDVVKTEDGVDLLPAVELEGMTAPSCVVIQKPLFGRDPR